RGAFDVLVMQTGYNDQLGRYEADARQILAAARAAGIRRIVWIAHAREFRTERGGRAGPQVYFEHNQVLRRIAADEVDVTLIEWNRLVRQRPAWTDPDGIHLRRPGGFALADVISRSVAHATARPCPLPEAPGAAPLAPCPDPSTRTPVAIDQLYDLSRSIVPCSIEGTRNETVCRWDHG
ncbi:MAG: SGNH/GDSL hydrolase family protein, partial [Actinomycetota bacterium]